MQELESHQRAALLLLARSRSAYPFNLEGLTRSQSSLRRLKRDYIGEQLLDQSGRLFVIASITVLGFYGNTFLQRFLSLLTNVRLIKTELNEMPRLSLPDIKALLERYLRYDAQCTDPLLAQDRSLEEVVGEMAKAKSIEEVFIVLNLPKLEDCLDAL